MFEHPVGVIITVIVVLIIGFYISAYNKLRRLSVKVEEGSAGIDVALEKRYDLLSEEIEAVKKFLKHEYETYVAVTSVRTGKDLEEAVFEEKKTLSKEAMQTIDETIKTQMEQMERIKKQMNKKHGTRRQKEKKAARQEAYENSIVEHKMNINQKIGLLSSIQKGLGGVGATIDALAEQYPVLYSYISMDHFQRSIFDAEEHLQAARRLYNANVSLYNQKIVMFPYSVIAHIHGMYETKFYEVEEKKREFQVNFD